MKVNHLSLGFAWVCFWIQSPANAWIEPHPATAQLSENCVRALAGRSHRPNALSEQSHQSHNSSWKPRQKALAHIQDATPGALEDWRQYLYARYGSRLSLYEKLPRQKSRFVQRLDWASLGDSSSLGELQIFEKYWEDPQVRFVEWIPEVKTSKFKQPGKRPDFLIHYLRSSPKLVEVKTRREADLPSKASYYFSQSAVANAQVSDFLRDHPDYRGILAEVEFVFHFQADSTPTHMERLHQGQWAVQGLHASDSLTGVHLNLNQRPFFSAQRNIDSSGQIQVEGRFLGPWKSIERLNQD